MKKTKMISKLSIGLLTISIFLISEIVNAQTEYDIYDSLIVRAEGYLVKKEFSKAIENYQNALDRVKPSSPTPYFKLAFCMLELNDAKKAQNWIKKGISEGGGKKDYLLNFEEFSKYKESKMFSEILSSYDVLRKRYLNSIANIDIYLEIEQMLVRDQLVRKIDDIIRGRSQEDMELIVNKLETSIINGDINQINKYEKMLFPEPIEEYKELNRRLIRKVDSINISRLITITEEFGWQENAWLILWHQRDSYGDKNRIWNHFKPLIDEEIASGTLSRSFWLPFENFNNFSNLKINISVDEN